MEKQTKEKKNNNGSLNLGFTNWCFAQTGKTISTPGNPWQMADVLSIDAGYENDNFYGYLLYTFNDNSTTAWLGHKFKWAQNSKDSSKKNWDVYGVLTRYNVGDSFYVGLGLEYSWNIVEPLSISYFVEAGQRNSIQIFSTGFMINFQQSVLKKRKKNEEKF